MGSFHPRMGCLKLSYHYELIALNQSPLRVLPLLDKNESPQKKDLDYSPYGMLLQHRHGQEVNTDYRYGFQGQEMDDEIKGEGNSINYEYRMHDPRIGRFFACDPLESKYPWYTPYQFSGNKVIQFVELEGLEEGASGSNSAGKTPQEMLQYIQNRMAENEAQIAKEENNIQQSDKQTQVLQQQIGNIDQQLGSLQKSKEDAINKVSAGLKYFEYWELKNYGVTGGSGTVFNLPNYYASIAQPVQTDSYSYSNYPSFSHLQSGAAISCGWLDPFIELGQEYLSSGLQNLGMSQNAANNTSATIFFFGSIIAARKAPRIPTGSFYSVAYEMKLSDDILTRGYGTHFRAANKSLHTAMTADATFASQMNEIGVVFKTTTAGKIKWDLSPQNYVWHHDVSPGVMQLVPKVQHTPGSIFWGTLHPNGVGGMAIWGFKAPLRKEP